LALRSLRKRGWFMEKVYHGQITLYDSWSGNGAIRQRP
jgi:hypothetical protein